MTRHYSLPELDACLNKDLPWPKSWVCRFHLSRCEECRKKLDEVREQAELLSSFTRRGKKEAGE